MHMEAYCDGLLVCPSLRPSYLCGPFSYCAAKGLFGCGPISIELSTVELRSLLETRPSKCYISLKSFLFGSGWAGCASE